MTTPSRRREAQPIGRGWELAVAAVGGALIAVGLAAMAGLGLASALWGGGWVWPDGIDLASRVLGGLLSGDPGRGLSPDQLGKVAEPAPVYACVAAAELVLLTVAVSTAVLGVRHRRPGDARSGMATRSEAAQALGLRQLRAGRAVIRPDLYPLRRDWERLGRLLSTGGDATRSRTHRSVQSNSSPSISPSPSTQTSPTSTAKEIP
ncbi:conjugal transfer protein [Modestobacter sp. VKM Ac-2979]|uniref:conjugal transfer protein n=1 Tax=unclassified Modestobacter TaxID=2643866 RepID=UPI0022AB9417|nr:MULTISPECIES: conjugal transfer protein [unclassified Modestobacter]MCZ2812030.1 conjugal transfer protein [Modestobacter sp. VKM Ac-2979]MCZ2843754.1 conjugal transfer protein [Modestobacter sp. VKM Ac-2980]